MTEFLISEENKHEFEHELGPTLCCQCGDPLKFGEKIAYTNQDHWDPAHVKCIELKNKIEKQREENKRSFAFNFAQELRGKHELTYGCSVNLEGTINNMLDYGMNDKAIRDVLEDIYDNLQFESNGEVRPA